ncbi:MAG: hypothetical protein LBH92_03820, partial [Bacteroidales bacterium]|nr:hypothetical protein [Bacteroidales bacterium]
MKNILFLLGMTAILLFATCKDLKNEFPTCTITAPAKDAEFNLDDEINVVVTANDDNGVIAQVQLYIDNEGYGSITNFPYNFTIPAETLKAGAHIIKAVAISNSGNKGEDVVSITVKNTFTECANFETFN